MHFAFIIDLFDGVEFLEVGNDTRSHGQPPALVEVEHVALLLLSPLLVAVVNRDVPQAAGITVVVLPHMAAESVELWRESKVWVVGGALAVVINNPLCELYKLPGQIHPWLVVVPLVLVVGRGVHTSKLECLVKCRGAILMPEP